MMQINVQRCQSFNMSAQAFPLASPLLPPDHRSRSNVHICEMEIPLTELVIIYLGRNSMFYNQTEHFYLLEGISLCVAPDTEIDPLCCVTRQSVSIKSQALSLSLTLPLPLSTWQNLSSSTRTHLGDSRFY